MSRDDSDIAAMMESSPNASMIRSGGLKGRFRRALSLNTSQTLSEEKTGEEVDDDEASIKASALGHLQSRGPKPAMSQPLRSISDDAESTATVQTKKKSRAASLFNSRLNASTDNISLSSTVSSASVMIRKLGSMGNLARRNSLAGITSLFKNKNKDGSNETGENKKDKKKKSGKGIVAEASVSHVTAELDRSSDWNVGSEMSGLSPAAKLARQHTLKSNAEAAARANAQQESAASTQKQDVTVVPETWERHTTTRGERSPARSGGVARVNEDGTRVFVEDDDSGSEDGSGEGTYDGHQGHNIAEGWDDDEDWGDSADDQDITIRVGFERTHVVDETEGTEEWATNVRRSMERVRVPKKGILKCKIRCLIYVVWYLIPLVQMRLCTISICILPTTLTRRSIVHEPTRITRTPLRTQNLVLSLVCHLQTPIILMVFLDAPHILHSIQYLNHPHHFFLYWHLSLQVALA